jgi:hypothetical protein
LFVDVAGRIVLGSPRGIAENKIGARQFLKSFLGASGRVGMRLLGLLAVGALDLILARGFVEVELGVEISQPKVLHRKTRKRAARAPSAHGCSSRKRYAQ